MISVLLLQLTLGVSIFLPYIGKALPIPGEWRVLMVSLHVAFGALLLASALLASLWSFRFYREVEA